MNTSITLESVKNEFIHWRASRASVNTRIPIRLKKHAIDLVGNYNKSQIISALEINHATLKKWIKYYGKEISSFVSLPTGYDKIPDQTDSQISVENKTQTSTQPTPSGLTITLRSATGAEMCITGDLTPAQLISLTNSIVGCPGETS